jgi:hypothetical protein
MDRADSATSEQGGGAHRDPRVPKRLQREPGQGGDAEASGHQILHHHVVVALEPDSRLEPGPPAAVDEMAPAARAAGDPGLAAQVVQGRARTVIDHQRHRFVAQRHPGQIGGVVGCLQAGAGVIDLIDRVIFDELTQGVIRDESRAAYQRVIDRLAGGGAQAVVLACTEIGLLLAPGQSALPMIDSAEAHAAELARVALAVPV